MRALSIRCLVAFLALALASWNVHAMGHGDPSLGDECRGTAGHAARGGHDDHRHKPADTRCCCDYVACAAAAIAIPALAVGSAELSVVSYRLADARTPSTRAPLLEPDPPRPSRLS